MTEFGQEIRLIRTAHQIALNEVAKRLRLNSAQYLYALEQGRIKASPKQAKRIVSILDKLCGGQAKEDLIKAYLSDIVNELD